MLHQASHWIDIAGVAVSALLLCRVLALRLHRVYLFITLVCILDLLFDGVLLWFGDGSPVTERIFLYSRFIYALVYPMVAWDVFEEFKAHVSKLRRIAIGRLISGLFFAVIFGIVMAAFIDTDSSSGNSVVVVTLALVLWAGATTASFAFVYTIYRVLRTQPTLLPNNTHVWMYYYGLSFLVEVISCFLWLGMETTNSTTLRDVLAIVFSTFDIVLTGWCIFKLRAVASDLPSTPEKATL